MSGPREGQLDSNGRDIEREEMEREQEWLEEEADREHDTEFGYE